MSKIEVNTVEPQCGTNLTIGASGDTITFPSGTTVVNNGSQTGFGRTGTVDWITTPKVTGDSPITAVTGKGYFLNTTAGNITVNLPAGAAGSIVSMADYAKTWDTYAVTVTPNGSEKIGGVAASASLDTEGQSVTFIYVDSTQGWVNIQDSTSNVTGEVYITATVSGTCNTITTSGNCKIATFKNPGTFTVCQVADCAANNSISYMVVGGGGGGGNKQPPSSPGETGAGGGAGGFRETKSPVTPYTASPLDGYPTPGNRITVTATGYPISVGGGGPGAPGGGCGNNSSTRKGTNTTALGFTGAGGGGGGSRATCAPGPGIAGGSPGGSGGGGTFKGVPPEGPETGVPGGTGNDPNTSPAQGFDGGNGPGGGGGGSGGGGGGATAVGGNAMVPAAGFGGTGGAGATTSINGTPTAYGGGGGGGSNVPGYPGGAPGAGGAGGGGAGGDRTPTNPVGVAGTDYTGGGGGGGSGCGAGGNGGSGIVIIRYKFQ